MDDFFSFKKFITPNLIKVLFWISTALSMIAGLVLIFSSFGPYGSSGWSFLIGLVLVLLGPIFSRVISETLYVLFDIHQNLESLKKKPKKQSTRKG